MSLLNHFPENTRAALKRIGFPLTHCPDSWHSLVEQFPNAQLARVTEQHRSGYVVATDLDQFFKSESPPEWQRPPSFKKSSVPAHLRAAVGDWVLLDEKRIVALLPRYSAIKRGAAGEHYQQQVIAANIHTVLIICGLDADFNVRRIERYLLLMDTEGVKPVVVLTKADISTQQEILESALAEFKQQNIEVFCVNATDAQSVSVLHPFLGEGQTVVLVGSSGAGKSTLTNTLFGEERMKTGGVREHDSRGRHTTTFRSLMALPLGACIIDTPGMRELKPTGEENMQQGAFSDIELLAEHCKFRDCSHTREPDCALRQAIQEEKLDPARFANYLKLREEVAVAAEKLAARLAQKASGQKSGRPTHKPSDKKYPPRR